MTQDTETSEVLPHAIGSVLVLDDDEVARNLIANHFRVMGVEDVVTFEDARSALTELESRSFSMIVSDWKLPGMSGLAFFNRVRSMPQHRNVPLMVVSGFINKDDFRLLQEFPCTALVEKPFTKLIFEKSVESLISESTWYGQNTAVIDTVLEAVRYEGKKAEQMIREIMKKAPNPVPLAVLAAKRLVKNDLIEPAKAVLKLIVERDGKCVPALNELGKILHMQGEHQRALDYLRLAARLSPQNLRRLCLMGEVELNLNDMESARQYFAQALVIDSEDPTAHAGMVVADNMSEFVPDTRPQDMGRNFASLMNTLGITLIRNGQFSRGIEQYRSALYFLDDEVDNAKVAFNLGLGFLRWGRLQEALPWFQKSEELLGERDSRSAAYVRLLIGKLRGRAQLNGAPKSTAGAPVASFDEVTRAAVVETPSSDDDETIDTTKHTGPALHVAEISQAEPESTGDFEDAMNRELDGLLGA